MTLPDAIRARLDGLAACAQTAADALADVHALDLCPGTLAGIAGELDTLAGRLDLVLDRLAGALDPAARCAGGCR
jgi:hypothetical protein